MPKCWAVIPAAGIGERVGASIPKQYLKIAGKTILEHAIHSFVGNSRITGITIALHPHDVHFETLSIKPSSDKIQVELGGETRAHSVLNVLSSIDLYMNHGDFVLVHDAARPCLTDSDLDKLIDAGIHHEVGAILGSRVSDTIKHVENNNIVSTINRENVWRAYTPQMFKYDILKNALESALKNNVCITDEASAIEYLGHQSCMVEGDARNIKVTTVEDIALAEIFLQKELNT
ncbi:MAG: 2-C-methyl-D-erythritol 4-phosphate cytidylyltransferase [Gammaproteobacteria bacterium]